jgi:hypothetical protein
MKPAAAPRFGCTPASAVLSTGAIEHVAIARLRDGAERTALMVGGTFRDLHEAVGDVLGSIASFESLPFQVAGLSRYSPPPSKRRTALARGLALRIVTSVSGIGGNGPEDH